MVATPGTALTVVTDADQYVVAVMVAPWDAADAGSVTTTQSTDVATVRAAYDAFNSGDMPGVLAVMQPDIEWIEFLEAGDVIVVLGWFAGTARASGTSFRSRFAHVIRMRVGLEASCEDISDAHALHVALGH